MVNNIYKHNSRSYFDVYTALVAAYPRKPTWIFKEMGGLFDFQSELQNRIATDILYPMTRESAYAFAAGGDYEPVEADGATSTLTITLSTAMSKTLPIGYQVGGISPATGRMVIYELTAIGNSNGTNTITVASKQKRTYSDILIAQIQNNNDFQDYPVDGYYKIIKNSAQLEIGGLTWTRVDHFDNSTSTDKHFQLLYQSQGKVRIRFGDGVTGVKPTVNADVRFSTLETTEGIYGVMSAGTVTINIGEDHDILAITNALSVGGNDAESVASIIRNTRGNVRLRDVVWSVEDLETASRKSSSSVQKALGTPGAGSASIHVVPSGGGDPDAGLISTVETYVQALTLFGAMPVTVVAPNYVPVNITATCTIRTGFVSATVKNLVKFALTLTSCAYDNQVLEYFEDNGVDATRILINTLWPGWAFTVAENPTIEFIINKWISLLGKRVYREWGQPLEVGDLWIMGNGLYEFGVDIFSLNTPTANTNAASDEIIDTGTVTVT